MDDTDDNDKSKKRSESDFTSQVEMIWSVGDQCKARWSGDNQVYDGTVKKLKHKAGRVTALVRFNGYESDDYEEVDVCHLQKAIRTKDGTCFKKTNLRNDLDSCPEVTSLFSPFTGNEDTSRLEDKYGHDSDSDNDEAMGSSASGWISPTPYQTKGKVSEWKVRSPAKSRTAPSQKCPIMKVDSPRMKAQTGKGTRVQKMKNLGMKGRDNLQPNQVITQLDVSSETTKEASDSCSRNNGSDSTLCTTDVFFEGFDDDDMEKPKFCISAPSEKVPFSLEDKQNTMEIPASLNQYLRDYQREGIQFLYSHYRRNRGAVLGDDMGLGKTVQVIGFLSALMGKKGNRQDVMRQKPRFIRLMSDTPDLTEESKHGPFLIIGPGSVLYNWLEELDTWAYFTVRKYHGADKAACLADVERGKVEIVVTTFETCRDNISALNGIKWDAVIADEVHRIKGLKAQTTKTLRSLKCVRRYGLTGTALQNSMSELWCILDWAQPNVLGSADQFEENFVRHIELGQKQNATKRELAEARKKKEEFAAVRSQMLLRRTKKLIADQLPVKTDKVVFCRLSPLQVSVYKAVLSHPDLMAVLQMNDKCGCGSGLTRGKCCFKASKKGPSPKSIMFTFMHVLLKASNHVALLIPHARMSAEQVSQAKKLCRIAFKDHPEFVDLARDAAFRTLSDPEYCGKMAVLQGMLSVFAKTHCKVLVFSYSTRLLDILEQHIMSEGHEYRRIDGSVTGRRRQEIVREFNSDPNIFLCLVSTKAGGLGLNMTGANKVVIFDPNWNPSHDLQAQDRAYRIGQRRNVEVYRLITAGSIEENVYLRQIYKQQLDNVAIGTENARRYFKGIQGDTRNKGELFGINNMFKLRTGDSCLTMDILKRNAKVEADLSGYEVADYIPSSQELQNSEDNSTLVDSGDGSNDDDDDDAVVSDDEAVKAFRDLFRTGSDDEEDIEQLPVTAQKQNSGSKVEPRPSTSGLLSHKKSATATSRIHSVHNNVDFDSSLDESVYRSEETSTTKALAFLDECEDSAERGGKRMKTKGQKAAGSKGGMSVERGTRNMQASDTCVQDSLVTPSFSSVSSVFEQCGVVHVHNNPEVVGASRVEDHVTRCAMHDVFDLSTNTQAPAFLCDPMSQPSEREAEDPKKTTGRKGQGVRRGRGGRTPCKDHNTPRSEDHGRWHILVGQTPTAIRQKHWSDMKVEKGLDDISLAERVLMCSPEERLAMLTELYCSQHDKALHEALAGILSKPTQQSADGMEDVPARVRKTTPRTPSTKTQPTGGRKKPSQKKVAAKKKQPVRRKRKVQKLMYDNEDDTQLSQKLPSFPDDDSSNDDSGFYVGTKVTPVRMRATPRKQRRMTRCRSQTRQAGSLPSLFERTQDVSPCLDQATALTRSDTGAERFHEDQAPAARVDVDRLLNELGNEGSSTKPIQEQPSSSKPAPLVTKKQRGGKVFRDGDTSDGKGTLSVLDDIFCGSEDSFKKKRRPPPSRGRNLRADAAERTNEKGSSVDRLVAPSSSGLVGMGKSRRFEAVGGPSTANSSDMFSDLMNNNTLRDDDVDCFGEPGQWKKRSKSSKAPGTDIERMLKESKDDYRQLFEVVHLVKKQRGKTICGGRSTDTTKERVKPSGKQISTKTAIDKDSSDFDPSGSLF